MNLSDIKTELFTRTTITDFGVRVESFDKETFQKKTGMDIHKPLFIITVNILKSGGVNITAMENKHLTIQQLDEIQRISQILRMEK
jgi:hypothetical protein